MTRHLVWQRLSMLYCGRHPAHYGWPGAGKTVFVTDTDLPTSPSGISRRTFFLSGTALCGGLLLGDALWREPHAVEVVTVALPLAKIPPGRELRLVQLSDLHMGAFSAYHEKVARLVNAQRPDLIVLTGDFQEKRRYIRHVERFLSLLHTAREMVAVQGNWEYWSRMEGRLLRRHLQRVGATLLINQRRDMTLKGVPLSILGLDFPSPTDNLVQLQDAAAADRLNILLSHVPAFDHGALSDKVDVALCGHTHGGQVRLPFLPPFYLPRFSGHFVEGLFHVGAAQTPLYVTRGIGTSVLPVRFMCRPEITVLRLQSRPQRT